MWQVLLLTISMQKEASLVWPPVSHVDLQPECLLYGFRAHSSNNSRIMEDRC